MFQTKKQEENDKNGTTEPEKTEEKRVEGSPITENINPMAQWKVLLAHIRKFGDQCGCLEEVNHYSGASWALEQAKVRAKETASRLNNPNPHIGIEKYAGTEIEARYYLSLGDSLMTIKCKEIFIDSGLFKAIQEYDEARVCLLLKLNEQSDSVLTMLFELDLVIDQIARVKGRLSENKFALFSQTPDQSAASPAEVPCAAVGFNCVF